MDAAWSEAMAMLRKEGRDPEQVIAAAAHNLTLLKDSESPESPITRTEPDEV
jgi:hypothetical protein